MKRNTYALSGLFVVLLIIAFLVMQKPGERSATSASSGFLCMVDSLSIDKIEIKAPASSLVLEKRGVEWFVAKPVNYKADQAAVGHIIHQIKNLEIKNIKKANEFEIVSLDISSIWEGKRECVIARSECSGGACTAIVS